MTVYEMIQELARYDAEFDEDVDFENMGLRSWDKNKVVIDLKY